MHFLNLGVKGLNYLCIAGIRCQLSQESNSLVQDKGDLQLTVSPYLASTFLFCFCVLFDCCAVVVYCLTIVVTAHPSFFFCVCAI